jgi:hypothetical protein
MKKNIFLSFLFLIFINQNSVTAQVIAASELFETIKSFPHPRYYKEGSPLKGLAFFIKEITKKNNGIVSPIALGSLKNLLEREGKNGDNPFNTFYEDLLIYLEQKYPSDPEIFIQNCTICFCHPINPIILSCNHMYCYNCLFEWYVKCNLKKADDTHKLCPLCRKNFDDSIITLFISDPSYKEKSDAAMQEYEQEEIRERILFIIALGSQNL